MESKDSILVVEGSEGALYEAFTKTQGDFVFEKVDYPGAQEALGRSSPAGIIFNLDHQTKEAKEILKALHSQNPGAYWVVGSEKFDSEDVIEFVRLGVNDFLKLPFKEGELEALVERVGKRTNGHTTSGAPRSTRRVLSFFSSKGGVGVTFIATNVSTALAHRNDGQVFIADFVLQHGNVAEYLDVVSQYTLLDFKENLDRVDQKLLDNSIHKHRSGVAVLPSPKQPETSESFPADETTKMVKIFKEAYDYTVLDLGHELNMATVACLDFSDTIFLVTTPDLPALCSAKNAIQLFKKLGYKEDKVKLVLNRWHLKGEIESSVIEKSLGYPITVKIPDDAALVLSAVNQGVPVQELNKKAEIVKSFDKFSEEITLEREKERT